MVNSMTFDQRPQTPDDVTSKVLRRAEIAKMSRTLQDKLAYASYKTKHGLNGQPFEVVEAQLAQTPKRRRLVDGSVVSSSSSSSSSTCTEDNSLSSHYIPSSSPLTTGIFSDDVYPATAPRLKSSFNYNDTTPTKTRRVKKRYSTTTGLAAYKSPSTNYFDSSPLQKRLHPDFRTVAGPNLSFARPNIAMPTSPPFGPSSPTSEHDLPTQNSFCSGSPPRTPPPTRGHCNTSAANAAQQTEGARLLLHLASSPTPADRSSHTSHISSSLFPPSTPPQHPHHSGSLLEAALEANVPSPGIFASFNTPAAGQFNLADFCNVTPSPAQAAFGPRTPATAKTPGGLGSAVAKRRLDFDTLLPPSPSAGRAKGLGMELGEALV